MAPRTRSAKLENRSARLRLPLRKKPYSVVIMRGVHLLYRRNKTAGPWMVRVCHSGEDWTEPLGGVADDYDEADSKHVLTFWQAQDLAREKARVGKTTDDLTVKARVERYKSDLESRGQDPANAMRVLRHLAKLPKLANQLVTASTLSDDLSKFRDHLAAKGLKPATIDRTNCALKAALNLAADTDERIIRRPWKTALKAIGSGEAGVRNVILDEADRRTARGAAYRDSAEFGLLFDVLDETGARSSQVARLRGEDVQADFVDPRTGKRQPRLMMPVSRKGGGKKARAFIPVPITPALADRLKGRSGVLLMRASRKQGADPESWAEVNLSRYFTERVLKGVRFNNPAKVTLYALRHTSIVRQLLAGIPIRIVAAIHDTSVREIENTYSAFITDHSDDLVRQALPQPAQVVPRLSGMSA
jgi:integrase